MVCVYRIGANKSYDNSNNKVQFKGGINLKCMPARKCFYMVYSDLLKLSSTETPILFVLLVAH